MKGWIKLHREIYDSDIWNDPATFRLFLLLIGKACHKDGVKVNGIELQQGQYIRSYRMLAKDLEYKEGRGFKQYSLSTIKRSVTKLLDSERVAVDETEHGTLFTILNYAKYQDLEGGEEETPNATQNVKRTLKERQQNNNKNAEELKNAKEIKTKRYKFDEIQMKLAKLLWKKVQINDPSMKEPNLDAWANTMRLMMEQDEREGKEIQEVILWSTKHDFWYRNILSAEKLRKQFNKLKLQMKDDAKPKRAYGQRNPVRTEKLPDWFDDEEQKPAAVPEEPIDNQQEDPLPVEHDKKYYKKLQFIEKMKGVWSEEKYNAELEKLNSTKTG